MSSLANGRTLTLLLKTRTVRAWPSVFAICADELIAFLILQSPISYRAYFWLYWGNAAIVACLRIWLAYDVFRSLPGSRFIPYRVRRYLLAAALVAAVVGTALVAPRGLPVNAMFAVYLNRCVTITWAMVIVCCLGGLLFSGFGFSITGMRIAAAGAVRLISSMSLTMIYTSSLPAQCRVYFNALDTVVAFGVAAYWCFAISDAPRAQAAFRADWSQLATIGPQPQ